jgi:thymidylate kinase
MSRLFKDIQINAELEHLICGMEIMLNEVLLREPNKNVTESKKRIEKLRDFQLLYLELSEEVRITEKNYGKILMEVEQYKAITIQANKKINELQKEIEQLKSDISL